MKNEFQKQADSNSKLGVASLVGVLTHKGDGVNIRLRVDGDSYDVIWLAATAIYRMHKTTGIPLDELGKQLNGAVEEIQEQT